MVREFDEKYNIKDFETKVHDLLYGTEVKSMSVFKKRDLIKVYSKCPLYKKVGMGYKTDKGS